MTAQADSEAKGKEVGYDEERDYQVDSADSGKYHKCGADGTGSHELYWSLIHPTPNPSPKRGGEFWVNLPTIWARKKIPEAESFGDCLVWGMKCQLIILHFWDCY